MRVKNMTEHGVFVDQHGVVPAGMEADVRKDSESLESLFKSGVLKKVEGGPSNQQGKGGDGS